MLIIFLSLFDKCEIYFIGNENEFRNYAVQFGVDETEFDQWANKVIKIGNELKKAQMNLNANKFGNNATKFGHRAIKFFSVLF